MFDFIVCTVRMKAGKLRAAFSLSYIWVLGGLGGRTLYSPIVQRKP
jgi:hypothetical protein